MIETLKARIPILRERMRRCSLCPRECGVNRLDGRTGFCGLGAGAVLARALPHFGEEPPISGTAGAGTLFLSSCNLRCPFCQNYRISRERMGEATDRETLAGRMLELALKGCHNIELVTPSPQLPAVLEALLAAREWGLNLPLVYNCGGYEKADVIGLLDGIVDVWLPDFKYGSEGDALACAAPADYPEHALSSIGEMIRQAGERLQTAGGIARRGVIIRHLVLPGRVQNSLDAVRLIAERLSKKVPLSLMAQYTPTPAVADDPLMGRRVTREEYEAVVDHALDLGFENLFIQEVDDKNLVPDFDREEPFVWE
ncbi:MAG: radical SAM protein [Syntrophobacterales bacterium]|nr:radical SAM protein [Syntrophobacterales bacterium]